MAKDRIDEIRHLEDRLDELREHERREKRAENLKIVRDWAVIIPVLIVAILLSRFLGALIFAARY